MTDGKEIQIIVFDVGEGDSIAVGFPVDEEIKWGIIDCCQREGDDEPPVLKFIREKGIKELEFLCLTHFHYDHYRGLSKVLEYFEGHNYPIHFFWRYGMVSPTDVCIEMYKYAEKLRKLTDIEEEKLSVTRYEKQFAKERVKELRRILEWRDRTAEEMRKQNKSFIRRLHGGTMFHRYSSSTAFYCLSPTGGVTHQREKYIARAAAGLGNILREDSQNANLSSAILLLTFGKATLLFGGDAGINIWKRAIDLANRCGILGDREIKADFVKASHHGSHHSSSKTLWYSILRENAFVAISADYRGNPYRHPHTKTLDDLRDVYKKKTIRVGCTNAPPVCIEIASITETKKSHSFSRNLSLISTTMSVLADHKVLTCPSVDVPRCFGEMQIVVNPDNTPIVTIQNELGRNSDCYYLKTKEDDLERAKRTVL